MLYFLKTRILLFFFDYTIIENIFYRFKWLTIYKNAFFYWKIGSNLTILFKFNVYIDRAQYTTKTFPSISVIKNFISVFEKAGSVLKIVHKPETKSKNQEETINQVKTLLTEFTSLSIQNMASAVHCFD